MLVPACDYCEKPTSEVGFIQSYRMIPTRTYRGAAFATKGARDIDLCATCAELLTREHVNKNPTRPKPCGSKRDGIRCMLERGHASDHLAVAGSHWPSSGWLVPNEARERWVHWGKKEREA